MIIRNMLQQLNYIKIKLDLHNLKLRLKYHLKLFYWIFEYRFPTVLKKDIISLLSF